jgi:spore coat polysaccharide biosynthesis protein SpsF
MTAAVMLQVRLDSSRLPEKALMHLGTLSVIEHAMASLRTIPVDIHLLLTDESSASRLTPLAEKWNFKIFTGPKDDVLKRFVQAIEAYTPSRIIRATGDNPLVSAEMALKLLQLQEKAGWDYGRFVGLPLGCGVELASSRALLEADRETGDPYDREHVTPFLYRHPDRFKVALIEAPQQYRAADMRVTLDTGEDYLYLKRIFEDCWKGEPLHISTLVGWFAAQQGSVRE